MLRDEPVRVEQADVSVRPHGLKGRLAVPEDARGLILFAHGSGEVLALTETALARLGQNARLETGPGAGDLFAEAGALGRVATLAGDWFDAHCQTPAAT